MNIKTVLGAILGLIFAFSVILIATGAIITAVHGPNDCKVTNPDMLWNAAHHTQITNHHMTWCDKGKIAYTAYGYQIMRNGTPPKSNYP